MQLRFFKALPPLKYQKRLHRATALIPIFRRVNLFLAGCSSAEPASASVQSQNSSERTIFTTCQKRQPLLGSIRTALICQLAFTFGASINRMVKEKILVIGASGQIG